MRDRKYAACIVQGVSAGLLPCTPVREPGGGLAVLPPGRRYSPPGIRIRAFWFDPDPVLV